jgi:putative sterol carrier protein
MVSASAESASRKARTVAFFSSSEEVYKYIGGAFRIADGHPEAGPKLRAANVTVRIDYTNPKTSMTIRLAEPAIEVLEGEHVEVKPDIRLAMSADNGNKFWRGEYNAVAGLAKGEAKARGPVSKILKLLPVTKPVFPLYKQLVAEKDEAI